MTQLFDLARDAVGAAHGVSEITHEGREGVAISHVRLTHAAYHALWGSDPEGCPWCWREDCEG